MASGMDAFLQLWDCLQAYAFPSFSLLSSSSQAPLLQGHSLGSDCSLAPEEVVPRSSEPLGGSSSLPTHASRCAQTAPYPSSTPEPLHATASCLETVEHLSTLRDIQVSHRVTWQLSLCSRPSLRKLYQHWWEVYHRWCADGCHSISSPTIAEIADFLLFLRKDRHLSVTTVRGFRDTLSSVFKYILPEVCDSVSFLIWFTLLHWSTHFATSVLQTGI